MRRRAVLASLAASCAMGPRVAFAQVPDQRPLLALLAVLPGVQLDAFRQGLSELGYVERQNIDLVERSDPARPERLPALAEQLAGLKPDIMLVPVSSVALVAKRAAPNTPIVIATMADPVRLGLIADDARPGGNVTGIYVNLDGLPGKQLEIAAEVVPGATKIGFLFNAANPGMNFQRPEVEAAAARLKVKLVRADVGSPEDIDAAFQTFAAERVGIVMVGQDQMLYTQRRRIAALAAAARLPFMDGNRELAEAGGVVSYGVSTRENYHRAAWFVDRILKGTKPGDLPVELPTKLEMVINQKAAKALGIAVPQTLLIRADEVIE